MTTLKEEAAPGLEILQHYLIAGIEVEYPLAGNPYGETMRRRLVGLNMESEIATLSNDTTIWAAHCKPVLRPFSQLATPLEDGAIPAVEIAKLIMQANRPEGRTPIDSYGPATLNSTGLTISVDCHRATSYTLEVLLDTTWAASTVYDFGIVYAHNMLAVHDYLRRNHFALPVNGRPLVEGVDFIAKTSSAPTPSTIQQKGGGDE